MAKSRPLGIASKNPFVAHALYQRILEKAFDPALRYRQPDAVLYARDIKADQDINILEGTEVMRKLNVHGSFFPEIDQHELIELPKRSVVYSLDLPPLKIGTTLERILRNKPESMLPLPRRLWQEWDEILDKWADAFLAVAQGREPDCAYRKLEKSEEIDQRILSKIRSPKRHLHGAIAIHGGMGPEAGNRSFKYIADQGYKGAILLDSTATMPNGAEFLLSKEGEISTYLENPLPRLKEVRKKLASLNFDATVMACNTMHAFHDQIIADTKHPERNINIVDESIRRLPRNASVLILATEASLATKIFEKSVQATGRSDLRLQIPSPDDQKKVEDSIWNYLFVGGDYQVGAKLLKEVADKYVSRADKNSMILLGCTELSIGLERGDVKLPVVAVDTADIANQLAIKMSQSTIAQSPKPLNFNDLGADGLQRAIG